MDDILNRIDAALSGITPGPWASTNGDEDDSGYLIVSEAPECEDADEPVLGIYWSDKICYLGAMEEDVQLMAAAPTLLADARAEIANLRAEIAQRDQLIGFLREELERTRASLAVTPCAF